jgi:hypothetical protein
MHRCSAPVSASASTERGANSGDADSSVLTSRWSAPRVNSTASPCRGTRLHPFAGGGFYDVYLGQDALRNLPPKAAIHEVALGEAALRRSGPDRRASPDGAPSARGPRGRSDSRLCRTPSAEGGLPRKRPSAKRPSGEAGPRRSGPRRSRPPAKPALRRSRPSGEAGLPAQPALHEVASLLTLSKQRPSPDAGGSAIGPQA